MKPRLWPVIVLLMLVACDREPPEETVWDDQLKTMDKARDAEQQVLDAAKTQRELIEQKTQ